MKKYLGIMLALSLFGAPVFAHHLGCQGQQGQCQQGHCGHQGQCGQQGQCGHQGHQGCQHQGHQHQGHQHQQGQQKQQQG